jgi:amino acid transporter
MEEALAPTAEATAPGLRTNVLSPVETLAQSISAIAPATTPTMTIPLVFVLAGNGTWLAYLLATIAILLIALCVSRFARSTSCAGSLYTYATSALPPSVSGVSGWALLFAYIMTGASVAAAFAVYSNIFLVSFFGKPASASLLATLCVVVSTYIAYRDVQVSARLMLWIEVSSVALIIIVLTILLWRNGAHIDHAQIHLQGTTISNVRLGVVLALFSFVGFESATTLGTEAINPLRTIPRAVIQSAVFTGIFFTICAYLETLGMNAAHLNLGQSTAPMRVLATVAGAPVLGPLIDLGALVSMFACVLACITAAARVLMRMGQNGLVHTGLGTAHHRNATPGAAVITSGILTGLPVVILALRGVAATDIYGWMGSFAVYGFITTYGLVAIALPIYLHRGHRLTTGTVLLSIAATSAMLLALAGTIYPVPEWPYNWLPYIYLAYIVGGIAWSALTTRSSAKQSPA